LKADPLSRVGHVDEHRRFDALPPQRTPEPLDLAERLWTTRFGHDVFDAAFLQFAAELALAAPRHVLRAVVGENLARHAVGAQRGTEHLDDQHGRL